MYNKKNTVFFFVQCIDRTLPDHKVMLLKVQKNWCDKASQKETQSLWF